MIQANPWRLLASRLRGRLILPQDCHFDVARRIWNAAIDRRPAGIVVCAHGADVLEAMRYASTNGLQVSIRGGGHSAAGRCLAEGALLIDLSALRSVRIDPARRRAIVEGGATWRDLDSIAGSFGLACTGGMVSTTGVAGLTLGGGIGWLMRQHGLAADALHSAEVVLADGRIVTTSRDENPELFWALRGGGGGFGVLTRLEFQLQPLSVVLAGGLWCRSARASEVLRAFAQACADAPSELTLLATATTAPPAPFLPEALQGQPVIVIGACWCGDPAPGEKALQALRAAVRADADLIRPMPYPVLQTSLDSTAPYGLQNCWKSSVLPAMPAAVVSHLATLANSLPAPGCMIHVHALGGAVASGPRDDPAAVLRSAPYLINAVAGWTSTQDAEQMAAWARSVAAFQPAPAAGEYVNFTTSAGSLPKQAFRDDIWQRLESIRCNYDPVGLFA